MTKTVSKPSLGLRILRFPLTRLILGVLMLGLGLIVGQTLISTLLKTWDWAQPEWLNTGVAVGLSILLYVGFVRLIEGRAASELSLRYWAEFPQGLLMGALVFSVVIGVLWLMGIYNITGVNGPEVLAQSIAIGLIPGFVEEIFFRGLLYRILEDSLGTWVALIITSAVFGFAHAGNPGATLFSSVAIALEAGMMLGIAYTLSKRLWWSIGIHTAWNFVQGGVYGVNVSGIDVPGLLQSRMSGPELLSGGSFGAEASLVAVIVCLAFFGVLLRQTYRAQRLILPFWMRNSMLE